MQNEKDCIKITYFIPYKHSFVLYVFVSIETVLWTSPPNIRSNDGTTYCNKINTISSSLLISCSHKKLSDIFLVVILSISRCLTNDAFPDPYWNKYRPPRPIKDSV